MGLFSSEKKVYVGVSSRRAVDDDDVLKDLFKKTALAKVKMNGSFEILSLEGQVVNAANQGYTLAPTGARIQHS
jgi:hypothetical protein